MALACDKADAQCLNEIAEALCREIGYASGEAEAGRRRLLQSVNSKLVCLGYSSVDVQHTPIETSEKRATAALIAAAVEDTSLCAHTRNFLQTALSRLERFDLPA